MTKEEVLKLFTTQDIDRLKMWCPWIIDGIIRATNGHILIRVPEELLPGHSFGPIESPLETEKIDSVLDGKDFTPLDFEALLKTLYSVKPNFRIKPDTDCTVCNGTGEVQCPTCSHCTDCGNCMGEGGFVREDGIKVPALTSTPFHGKHFNWHYLNIIKLAIETFGGTWLICGNKNPLQATNLKSEEGVQIAIMPMRV